MKLAEGAVAALMLMLGSTGISSAAGPANNAPTKVRATPIAAQPAAEPQVLRGEVRAIGLLAPLVQAVVKMSTPKVALAMRPEPEVTNPATPKPVVAPAIKKKY